MERKPRVFLGSSSKAAGVLRMFEAELSDRGFNPVPWIGAFGLSHSILSELWRLAHEVDFAVFLWSADALLDDNGVREWATRDNVIYEAGLFAGVLSPARVFVAVEARDDVKIPSDFSGIGHTRYEPDVDGVRSAAIAIQKAIVRVEQETDESDVTRSIEGLWIDAIVSREERARSVISTFELRRTGYGGLDIVNGQSWDPDGEPRAEFSSTSARFDASANTLHYGWRGTHPRETGVPEFFGVGELEFDPAHPDRAKGWFSSCSRLAPERTFLVSRVCLKAPFDAQALVSNDREIRKQAVTRLLQWWKDL